MQTVGEVLAEYLEGKTWGVPSGQLPTVASVKHPTNNTPCQGRHVNGICITPTFATSMGIK